MKRFRVVWRNPGLTSLESHVALIASDNPSAARSQRNRIVARVTQLAGFPLSGRPGRVKGTRELVATPWVIVYRVRDEFVEILRVLHGRQKWPR